MVCLDLFCGHSWRRHHFTNSVKTWADLHNLGSVAECRGQESCVLLAGFSQNHQRGHVPLANFIKYWEPKALFHSGLQKLCWRRAVAFRQSVAFLSLWLGFNSNYGTMRNCLLGRDGTVRE